MARPPVWMQFPCAVAHLGGQPSVLSPNPTCCREGVKKIASSAVVRKPSALAQSPQCCRKAVRKAFSVVTKAGARTKPSALPQSPQCWRPDVKKVSRAAAKLPVLLQSCKGVFRVDATPQRCCTAVKRASSGVAKHPVLSESREERSLVASQKTFSGVTKPSVLPQSCVESLRCCHKGRTHAVLPQSFKCCEAASAVP